MNKLENVLTALGWTLSSLERASDSQICPLDKGHLVPRDRLDAHLDKCRLRQRGYSRKEVVNIVDSLTEALWKYDDKEIRKFSDAGGQSNKSLNLSIPTILNQPEKQPTLGFHKPGHEKGGVSVQELAFVRDLKRRRQSYRGIHTAKKSYIEVLREVIEHHAALLNHSANPDQNLPYPYREDAQDVKLRKTPDRQCSFHILAQIRCAHQSATTAEGNRSTDILRTAPLVTENKTDQVTGGAGVRQLHHSATVVLAACWFSKRLCSCKYIHLSACHICMVSFLLPLRLSPYYFCSKSSAIALILEL
ncbi:U11/U12 small nuclear ribonucleoprotein [Echinococcus granulosus]|uniref:U11/U12 small nuclear ribonucleoprotein n=1 Tax=Echinococcus granulosus TaxID=6210 RepID=W6V8G1_ECHGR|nr:U11/U12 small nuclear ribonucleoprotein [Echinococcus granulosus]EUB62799.1 U11/U12 small nuclear ribonucleoprotein [Echinococcus granulosus]